MRIPIPIFSQRKRQALELPGKCERCGAERGFFIEREEIRVWLLFLPMGAQQTQLVSRCQACGAPAPALVLKKVPRANPIIRFGWLFFLVIPLLGFGTYHFVVQAVRRHEYEESAKAEESYRQRKAAEENERREAETAGREAYEKARAAKQACFDTLDKALNAMTKDIDKEKPRPPKDLSALLHAPSSIMGHPEFPEGPYLSSDSPCPITIDDDWEYGGAAVEGYYQAKPLDDIRAKTKEMLAAAKSLTPPPRWALVTFGCNDWSCWSTAAWFDRSSKTILAVARATKPKGQDEDADKKTLKKQLSEQIARWK